MSNLIAPLAHTASTPLRSLLRRPRRLAPAVILLSLLLALIALAGGGLGASHADGPSRNGITVSAEGSATLPPDVARISANVETRTDTASDALSQNSETLDAVIAAVKTLGATGLDVQTSGVRLDPINTPGGGVIGYRAVDAVTVRTTDLTRIGDLIQAMASAGVTNINSVDYALQDPDQLQLLAVRAAIANARQRGVATASALGVRLGEALDFAFGVKAPPGFEASSTPRPATATPPPPPPASAAPAATPRPAALPAPPVLPASFSARMTVTITYAIVAP